MKIREERGGRRVKKQREAWKEDAHSKGGYHGDYDDICAWQFHSSMHKWGLSPSPNCECGASEQTANHILTACPIHRAPHGARGLTVLDDETRCWLSKTTDSGSSAVWGSKKINPRSQSCLCLTWSGYPANDDDDDEGRYLKYWKDDWKGKRAGRYDGAKECRRIVPQETKEKVVKQGALEGMQIILQRT